MSTQHFAHLVHHAFEQSKKMKPVEEGKSAVFAFLAGFFFGPFGVGIYLRSWEDFIISLLLVVVGSALTAGLGAPVFWILCGAWGAVRVHNSNA